jgi:hypothetical protein
LNNQFKHLKFARILVGRRHGVNFDSSGPYWAVTELPACPMSVALRQFASRTASWNQVMTLRRVEMFLTTKVRHQLYEEIQQRRNCLSLLSV